MMTASELRAQIEALKYDKNNGRFYGYNDEHMWTHKSGLTRFSYFKDLLLPHNIDLMHTEKNIAEALFVTLMDFPDKSKDNVKARLDLATLCDRPKEVMKPPAPGKQWRRTPVDWVLKKDHRKEVLQWLKTLMFPDGHAASLSRGVNLSTMRVFGMKSHDYHIWIERLLPAMTRGYVPDHVWRVLAELSFFFRQLCAKELSREVIDDLEKVDLCCFASSRESSHPTSSWRCSI
jgi:hypothetical protein